MTKKSLKKKNQQKSDEKAILNQKEKEELLSNHIIELIRYSYELEEKREESLINQSSRMLEVFSIITAGLGLLLPVILQYLPQIAKMFVFLWTAIIAILLITSLILATLAQWRYKYKTMPLPQEIYNHIYINYKSFLNKVSQMKHWVDLLNDIQTKRKEINDKRANFVKSSMICFYIAIDFFFFASVLAVIKYILK